MIRSPTLIFRCDANVTMGTGHVMRCLALAQAWQDAGGEVSFAMAEATPSIEARLRIERIKVVRLPVTAGSSADAEQTSRAATEEQADWVVVDGYQFGAEYQRSVRASGLKILAIDDNGETKEYSADLVLNQNLHACETLYQERQSYTKLLLGSRYVLLRREFSFWRARNFGIAKQARRILVTLGGSDPDNFTQYILRILAEDDLDLTVVVGGSNPHLAAIEQELASVSRPVRLLKDVGDMPALMVWADVAIAGAGTTSWEMCMMGLPAALCVLAPNQERIASELERLGAAINLGHIGKSPAALTKRKLCQLIGSESERRRMSSRGRDIVDGRGTERVVALLWGDPSIRRSIEADCRSFWEWANDPAARAVSFAKEPILWERHMEWFRARLADPQSVLYTALNRQGDPVGMVRFQLEGDRAVLSINLGAPFRGQRRGRKLLFLATADLFEKFGTKEIDAFVRVTNKPSVRLFEGAGFRSKGVEIVRGDQAIHYVLDRDLVS